MKISYIILPFNRGSSLMAWLGIFTLLQYSCTNDGTSKNGAGATSPKKEMSAKLVKANELTKSVFDYVEAVEMKKMTQEEANRLSSPVKNELQRVREQLSKEELIMNDSIRKVLGNIMVDNVMKWRTDMGLIKPDTLWK